MRSLGRVPHAALFPVAEQQRIEHGLADLTVQLGAGGLGSAVGVGHFQSEAIRDRPDVGGREQQLCADLVVSALDKGLPEVSRADAEGVQDNVDRQPLLRALAANGPDRGGVELVQAGKLTQDQVQVPATDALEFVAERAGMPDG